MNPESPPHFRSGWDHDYRPPHKCKEEGIYTTDEHPSGTDIVICEPTENVYTTPVYEQTMDNQQVYNPNSSSVPTQPVSQSNPSTRTTYDWIWDEWTNDNGASENVAQPVEYVEHVDSVEFVDPINALQSPHSSWFDQFDQVFYGNQQKTESYHSITTDQIESHSDIHEHEQQIHMSSHHHELVYPIPGLNDSNPSESSIVHSNYEQPPSLPSVQYEDQSIQHEQPQIETHSTLLSNSPYPNTTSLYNTEQCIHTYNIVNTVEDIHTPEDILISQTHLMSIAGEITEYEESYLQQLILQKDPSVSEALRRYALGETQSLIQLLHAYDSNTNLLMKKDEEYAQYIAKTTSHDPPPPVSTIESTSSTYQTHNQDQYLEYESGHPLSTSNIIQSDSQFEQLYTSLYDNNNETIAITTLERTDTLNMNALPPLFYCNDTLCGMILKRVTSKKIFKKWNRCVFEIKSSFLQLYRSTLEWKQKGPIYWKTLLHSYMHVSPIVRKSYDNILVYTFEIVENPRTNVHLNAAMQGVSFSSSLPVREVAVFGSAYYGIVKTLHDKVDEFIKLKVDELASEL